MTLCCWKCILTTDPDQRRKLQLSRERKRIHEEIEKDLQNDRKRRQKEHRILLLGCGEAGKSTFIKQMRIIHSSGFSHEERLAIKQDIASNIVSAIQTLLNNISEIDEVEMGPNLREAAERVRGLPDTRPEPSEVFAVVDFVQKLWQSEPIQSAYARRNTFQLVECAKYFLSRASQVMDPAYEPTDGDIVQARVRTEGIIEHEFEISTRKGEVKKKLILIDVGGQRSERRKWIHCFEDVLLIIFLTAVSEYDQVLAEDETTNRMNESLRLFKTILEYHWFKDTNVILFLNKKDLLEEKVQASHVRTYFPEYEGPDQDAEAAINFFTDEFRSRNPNPDDREIFVHPTCATDTENIKLVDVVVQNTITKAILENIGLN